MESRTHLKKTGRHLKTNEYKKIKKMKMKKLITIFGAIIFTSLIIAGCGSNSSSSNGSQDSYQHTCSHCSKGYDGNGYIKDSGGNVILVSDSEVDSYYNCYCSEICALLN